MSERQQKHRSDRISAASSKDADSLEHFKRRFPERFLVRFHMTVLLLGVCASGLLTSKLLLEFGLRSMLVRYLIAVCAAYAVFFLLMRIWLWYVGASPKKDSSSPDVEVGDAIDVGQMSVDVIPGGAGSDDIAAGTFSGTGGDFDGGGATDMWGDAATASAPVRSFGVSSGHGSSGTSGGSGFDFDFNEGLVLIAVALLLLVIFGAGAYLVYAAPEILSEAAFEALLAGGLIKASRKITRQGWIGSVLTATIVPFLVVLLMAGAFGWVAQRYYPHAARLGDIFKHSSSERQ